MYASTSVLFSVCSKKIKPMIDYIITISFCKLSLDTMWDEEIHNNYFYSLICDFFYYKLPEEEEEEKIKPKSKLLITVFPHGLFCWGYGMLGGIKSTNKYYKAITNILLKVPIFGYWLEKLNCVGVDKKTMVKLMSNHDNIIFLPGGFNEVMTTCNFEYNRIYRVEL
jgi:hypothetical protein